jgi:hypothetical protein
MSLPDFDSQYGGYGIPSGITQDSGAVAVTTTPKTITLTVPLLGDGVTQPTVIRGQVVISINSANASMVLGQIDISSSDGTHTVCLDSIPAAVAATAGRGGVFNRSVFIDRVDTTTIKTIVVVIATTASNVYTAEVRFLFDGQN